MSETAVTSQDEELFDSADYEVPFPKIDGRERNELVIAITGTIDVDRNDPEHAAFIEGLAIGRWVPLTVTAQVIGKRDVFKQNAYGAETVTHTVGMRVQEVEPA